MKNKKLITILGICIVILTIGVIHKALENDTYFTIQTGNYILQHGVDEVEPFTWHENLKFVKLRWGFDVLVAIVYKMFGFAGIYIFTIIMSALIGICTFLNLIKRKNSVITSFLITVFTVVTLSVCLKCRGQIMSYLFFGLEIYSIQMLLETRKKRYSLYLIAISFGILTFHSSVWLAHFIFYAPYILEWFLNKIKIHSILEKTGKLEIEERNSKTWKLLFATIAIVIVTGFLTPLKLSPFTYMFKVMGGYSTKIINELQPLKLFETPEMLIIMGGVVGILSLTKTKIKLTDICLIVGLMIMSKLAIRNMFIAVSVLAFPVAKLITSFIETFDKRGMIDKIENSLNRNIPMLTIIVLACISISIANYRKVANEKFVDETSYPVQASEFIKSSLDIDKIRLYNHFNFGSYLELQGIPTFVDSRSEVYCQEFNHVDILEDFAKFDLERSVKPDYMIEKYGITHFIFMKNNINGSNMECQAGYKKIYDDGYFVIIEVENE